VSDDHGHWPTCDKHCAWCADCHAPSCVCPCGTFAEGPMRPGDWCCVKCRHRNPSTGYARSQPIVEECGRCELKRIGASDMSVIYGWGRDCRSDPYRSHCRRSTARAVSASVCASGGLRAGSLCEREGRLPVTALARMGFCRGGELPHAIDGRF
jgi:hypothetical protein